MRAHANCVENLPIYGAIVVALLAASFGRSAFLAYLRKDAAEKEGPDGAP